MMMGTELPLTAGQRQIGFGTGYYRSSWKTSLDESRRAFGDSRGHGVEDGQIRLRTLYEFREEGMGMEKLREHW